MMDDGEPSRWTEAEFVLIGIELQRGKAPVALLARDGQWGLEYVGRAAVALPESELERLLGEIEPLASDYPHLKVRSRSARWLLPRLRVRARHPSGANARQRGRTATVVSLLPA
jgi:ATP-dependent DNA ligase